MGWGRVGWRGVGGRPIAIKALLLVGHQGEGDANK